MMLHNSPLLPVTTSVVERGVVAETVATGADVGVNVEAKVGGGGADVDTEWAVTEASVVKGEGLFRRESVSEPIGRDFALGANEGRLLEFLYATATATPRQNPMITCRFVHPDDLGASFF